MDGKSCPPQGVRRTRRVGRTGRITRRVFPQHCIKCGYRWESRIATPKECPQCKNRKWKACG